MRKSAAILFVLSLAVLALALVPAAGLAAKGGNGGGAHGGGGSGGSGGGSTPPTSATLYSSCNPCAVGTVAQFWGSGYDASNPRGMAAIRDSAGNTTWIGVNVASDGTTSFELYMSPADTYDVKVLQSSHKQLELKAELAGLVVQ
jgi:hypothetical protein